MDGGEPLLERAGIMKPACTNKRIAEISRKVPMTRKPLSDRNRSSTQPAMNAALRVPNVVVRVRPLAESGGHSDEREAVYRTMVSWEDSVIVLEDNVGHQNGSRAGVRRQYYTFANGILGASAEQSVVYDAVAAEVVKAVCDESYNGFIFAYGQTGTGCDAQA